MVRKNDWYGDIDKDEMNSYHEYLKEEGNLPLAIFDVGKKMQL